MRRSFGHWVLGSVLLGMLSTLMTSPAAAFVDQRVRGRASHLIAAGSSHAFVIEHGGGPFTGPGTFSWGTNASGELGTGASGGNVTRPTSIKRFSQIAAGQSFTVAIDGAGALYGWGVTAAGQTAVRLSTSAVTAPTKVTSSLIWKNIAAGANHACGITAGGQLYCWGDNTMGELGLGTSGTGSTATPSRVGTATDRWISVAAGPQFTLAIKADGTAWGWGSNSTAGTESGQLGINNTGALLKATPTAIGSARWVAIAAGGSHGLGIQDNGSLWTWGYNTAGELGDGSTTRHSAPIAIEVGSTFIAVAAGALDSFALRSDGTLRTFGSNAAGQLGCPTCSNPQKSPATVGANYQYVAAGSDFTLAVTADGNLQTWGNNGSGQLGRSGTANTPTLIPDTAVATFVNIKPGVVVGGSSNNENVDETYNGARIKSSGVLEMWGAFGALYGTKALGLASGQSGTINQLNGCDTTAQICSSPLPVAYVHKSSGNVVNPLAWRDVATGLNSTLAISSDGTLWGWGLNDAGEVGNGTKTEIDLAVQVSTAAWLRIFSDPAGSYTVGIKADGTMWHWGSQATATAVQLCTAGACAGKHWAMATVDAAGGTLAIATDGSFWGWQGTNAPLQLNGSNPSVGPTGSQWASLTWIDAQVHGEDSLALASNGEVWGWGYNVYGQIGNGTTSGSPYPLPVTDQADVLGNVVNVASCSTSQLALDGQGAFWGWGENAAEEWGIVSGELDWPTNGFTGLQHGTGIKEPTEWSAPPPIPMAIACGGSDAFVLDDDGWVWALGADFNGQLGVGFTSQGGGTLATQTTANYPAPFEPNGQTASVNNQLADCPNTGCVWTTSSNQTSGEWFQVDNGAGAFQNPPFYTSIRLLASNTSNYPRAFKVLVSNDNVTFTQVTTGTGGDQTTTIPLGLQSARYVRVQLTAAASAPWDIGAVSVNY